MKLVVQIPCLNEEKTLPMVLKTIPKKIKGIEEVIVLIIDDGSSDKTIEVAKKHGVKHFVLHRGNQGLARSFHDGIDYALSIGADIVVNTDGDNQYPQERIPDLIKPILNNKADIVVGDRQTSKIEHFSIFKKLMQKFGSWTVNKAAGTKIPDAASGYRAYSKEALFRLNVVTRFSYCMETIIQAGNKGIVITSIPVTTNPKTRESRLFKNIWQHMFKSGTAIIRAFIMYRPHVIFSGLGLVLLVFGAIPFLRFVVLTINSTPGSHIQSLILGSVFLIASFLCLALAVIADLTRSNRTLSEDGLERIKKYQFNR